MIVCAGSLRLMCGLLANNSNPSAEFSRLFVDLNFNILHADHAKVAFLSNALADRFRMLTAGTCLIYMTRCQPGQHFTFGDDVLDLLLLKGSEIVAWDFAKYRAIL